jgi:16S rRNA (cytosine967-C5)-methyltransferase
VERWKQVYGEEVTRKICEHDQEAPRTAVRISHPSPTSGIAATIEAVLVEPGKLLTRAAIVSAGEVTQTESFREHRVVIQDEASQLVALLVGEGKTILDCCAAPGGKARILAEGDSGATVVAMELHPRRAALLKKILHESNVRIVAADARAMPFGIQFDRILVDAPCSGTGTLARNPEIKWRLKPDDLSRLQSYQVEILSAAMKQVAVGGRIVYSTCSLELEENAQVIEKVMAGNSDFRVVDARDRLSELQEGGELAWNNIDSLLSGPYLRTVPGAHPCDGFFAAILERKPAPGSH